MKKIIKTFNFNGLIIEVLDEDSDEDHNKPDGFKIDDVIRSPSKLPNTNIRDFQSSYEARAHMTEQMTQFFKNLRVPDLLINDNNNEEKNGERGFDGGFESSRESQMKQNSSIKDQNELYEKLETNQRMASFGDPRFVIKAEPRDSTEAEEGAAGMWAYANSLNQGSPKIKTEVQSPTETFAGDMNATLEYVAQLKLIPNADEFVCSICEDFFMTNQGVVLMGCHHNFCQPCLTRAILSSKTKDVRCPMRIVDCHKNLQFCEIEALLPKDAFEKFIMETPFTNTDSDDMMDSTTMPNLMDLEQNHDYVENRDIFKCTICLTDIMPGDGIMLKNCLHEHCKTCLALTIEMSEEMEVPCPYVADNGTHCEGTLQDRELRSLITDIVYSAHLEKSLKRAEAITKNSFHCKTPDCPSWAEIGELVTSFICPICMKTNCVKCEVIHEGRTCLEYFYENNEGARKNRDDTMTANQLQQLIVEKKAQACPGCGVVIEKTVGCNHMTCSRCKRQFQWHGLA